MRYIKKFNEGKNHSDSVLEIRKFCEESLIDLIDDGFSLRVEFLDSSQTFPGMFNFVRVVLLKTKKHPGGVGDIQEYFKWDEIKDKMIPFLDVLMNNYELDKPYKYKQDKVPFHKKGNLIIIQYDWKSILFTAKQLIDGGGLSIQNTNLNSIVFFIKL